MKSSRTHSAHSKSLWAFAGIIWCIACNQVSAQSYTIAELPPLVGDTSSHAYALNESGQAAGDSGDFAVIWTNGVPNNIHGLSASFSVAFALNDAGHAAGDVSSGATNSGGFIWQGAFMQRIIPPSGEYIIEAYAMNNAGTVVGTGGTTFGWRWNSGSYLSLNPLAGDFGVHPYAINGFGIAAGRSNGPMGSRPVIWTGASAQVLPLPAGATRGLAWGINDLGAVVGEYYPGAGSRPYFWSSSLGAQALPLPPGATGGYAWAINDAGTVIGEAGGQPVVWRKNSSGGYEAVLVANQISNGSGWSGLTLYAINESGQIAGEGRLNNKSRGFILTPGPSLNLLLRTDADRNGTTDFDTSSDVTGSGNPFYFWTNDDHDASGIELPVGFPDSANERIMTPLLIDGSEVPQLDAIRDLEDFARLAFKLTPELLAAIDDGATISLEVRGSGTIHLFSTPIASSETLYLKDQTHAVGLITNDTTNVALVSSQANDGSFTWNHLEALITPADQNARELRFLWEGVTPGVCILTLKLTQPDGSEIASDPVHLSLHPVRDYFERVRATPRDGFPPPWNTNGQTPLMNWEFVHQQITTPIDQQDVDLVWVHGWRLREWERQNWAEMMFKRLWHGGYRGRLHAFTWPTLSGDDAFFESGPDGKLSYDRSEFRAWKSGEALEGYLRILRNLHSGGRLVIVSHSMGNVVTGEALRREAPVDLQIMMQAALPAGCYDIRSILNQPELLGKEHEEPTPDFDVDLGYRGFLSHVNVPTINYYNESDFALQTGVVVGFINASWLTNQRTKPDDPTGKGTYGFREDIPGLYSGKKRLRVVFDVHESLAFLARSRTRAVGADARTQFPQAGPSPNVNLEHDFNFTRDSTEHSAQFNRPIQRQLTPLYTLIRRTVTTETQ